MATKLRTLTEDRRPVNFDEIIDVGGQVKKIKSIIIRKIKQNMLFIGPKGSGKTTAAWAAARLFVEVNLSPAAKMMGININDHIKYFNASKEGIDTIRNKVQSIIDISGVNSIILDEFDGISRASQNALRSIMEEGEQKKSPKQFILTGNDLSKIIEPIISRCGGEARIFPKIPLVLMQPKLINILKDEGITEFKFKPEVITKEDKQKAFSDYFKSLYVRVNGDMRAALKIIETVIEVNESGKSLDLSSEIVDLTTNAFYLQLDKILLEESEIGYETLLDSIDELVYKKDGNAWDRFTFFYEAFTWLKNRHNKFSYQTLLKMASIVAKFENRMNNGANSIQIQVCAMVAEMRRARIKEILTEKMN